MAIKGLDIKDYFMRKYGFEHLLQKTLKDELANEINPRENVWSGHILTYK